MTQSFRSRAIVAALSGFKRLADAGALPAAIDLLLESHGLPRSSPATINLSQIKSVAVIRLDEIGDVVLTFPLLRELRSNLPHANITMIVKPPMRALVEKCPYIDRVLDIPPGGKGGGMTELRQIALHYRAARKNLWNLNLDLALIPRWDMDLTGSRLLAKLSGARWRVGFADPPGYAAKRPFAPLTSERFLTHVVTGEPILHEALRPLELLQFIGGEIHHTALEFWADADDDKIAERLMNNISLPRVVFAIAALQEHRRWPVERYAAVASHLRLKYNASILLIGGPADKEMANNFVAQVDFPVTNLVGKSTLRQTGALLKRSRMYIGNDTGPMHIAAAVGTPIVCVINHPTGGDPNWPQAPERFAPFGVPRRIVRPQAMPPCTTQCNFSIPHCINNVSVEQVIAAVDELWAST